METIRKYKKKRDQYVVAVRLDLDTDGFSYQKWGSLQQCKPGDWLVDNAGDIYSIDADFFERTYTSIGGGRYVKKTPVWAEIASSAGSIATEGGKSYYTPGDYIIFNSRDRTDAYCMSADKFEAMYEPCE
jgi:hypothetical protein